MITVLLADDQDLVRAGLRALLGGDDELKVVAEAPDGQEALVAARVHRPRVVLMDIRMPVMNGIEAARRLCRDPELAGTRVLMLTTFDEESDVLDAIAAGAAGYLLKDTPAAELRQAVRTVAAGGNLLSPAIARTVMEHLAQQPRGQDAATELGRLEQLLTERELQVLARVSHGETNAEIAAALYLSPATARTYVSRILTKLGARDRTELAIIGHRAGLYRP